LRNEKDLEFRKSGSKNQTEFMKSAGKRNNKAMNVVEEDEKRAQK